MNANSLKVLDLPLTEGRCAAFCFDLCRVRAPSVAQPSVHGSTDFRPTSCLAQTAGSDYERKATSEYYMFVGLFSATFGHMLYTIVVVLVILWLLGFIAHIGGGLIHLLLVIALIVLIFNFISGRR